MTAVGSGLRASKLEYRPLQDGCIRLVRYLPHCTPDNIHLGLEHHFISSWDLERAAEARALSRKEHDASPSFGVTNLLSRLRLAEEEGTIDTVSRDIEAQESVFDRWSTGANKALRPAGKAFIAVSYQWGDPKTRRDITVNGHKVSVTLNLWLALSGILKHHHTKEIEYYWIDALCINQEDNAEKARLVRQMWKIYSVAPTVFAWVDPQEIELDPAWGRPKFDFLRERYDMDRRGVSVSQWVATHAYFTRTWIQSEVLQGAKVLFLFGRTQIESLDLHLIFKACKTGAATPGSNALVRRFEGGSLWSFQYLLRHYSRTECGDRRDIIFAMQADPAMKALGDPEELRPDYDLDIRILAVRALSYMDRVPVDKSIDIDSPFQHTIDLIRALRLPSEFDASGNRRLDDFAWELLLLLRDWECLDANVLRFKARDEGVVAEGPRLKELLRVMRELRQKGELPASPFPNAGDGNAYIFPAPPRVSDPPEAQFLIRSWRDYTE